MSKETEKEEKEPVLAAALHQLPKNELMSLISNKELTIDGELYFTTHISQRVCYIREKKVVGRKKAEEYYLVTCPHCKSRDTELISQFGSTACKSLYKCHDCKEPFDYFKCL